MQERVGLPGLGRIVATARVLGIVERIVILGMLLNPVGCNRLERRENATAALLVPGGAKELPDFVAARIEHGDSVGFG